MALRIAAEGKTVSKQGKFVSNHDVKSGGGGSELNVTMTLIFPVIVWMCPLSNKLSYVKTMQVYVEVVL